MGCLQSKQEDKSGSMGSMTAIGRTERMIQHRQNPPSKQGSNSNEATNDLKNQLKQSIRDRASDNASASGSSLKNPDLDATGRLMPGEVASRRKTSVKTHFTTIMDGKITIEYAVCSQRGYYPDGKCYLLRHAYFLYVHCIPIHCRATSNYLPIVLFHPVDI